MRNCNNCLDNNWKFSYSEGWVKAECQMCGHEEEFEAKEKVEWKEGTPCRHCKTPVVLRESKFKPSKLNKPYYYTAYYRCPKCKAFFMSDKFKIINH